MYTKDQIIAVAKRDNNKKRNFLLVNRLQGKHLPVSPIKSIEMFKELSNLIEKKYDKKEKFLIIGFAETATAIAISVALELKDRSYLIHTTREEISNMEYFNFLEKHSHATNQGLVKKFVDETIDKIDRIIFVEDEVTTGETIRQLKELLEKTYPEKKLKFGIVSIMNAMDEIKIEEYKKNGIECQYILKINKDKYENRISNLDVMTGKDKIIDKKNFSKIRYISIGEYIDSRLGCVSDIYNDYCSKFIKKMLKNKEIIDIIDKKVLVLGTEEFMYPGLRLAFELEKEKLAKSICFHATTRSPIVPALNRDYPINSRYSIRSLYEKNRMTYIYNLQMYDKVLIVHDSTKGRELSNDLIVALQENNCTDIVVVQWGNCRKEKHEEFI